MLDLVKRSLSAMANASLLLVSLLTVITINYSGAIDFTSFHAFGESIKEGFESAKESMIGFGQTIKEKFEALAKGKTKRGGETFKDPSKSILGFASDVSSKVKEFTGDKAKDAAEQIKKTAEDAAFSTKRAAESAAATVKEKAEAATASVKEKSKAAATPK